MRCVLKDSLSSNQSSLTSAAAVQAMGIQRYIFFSIFNCDKHPEVPLMNIKSCTEKFLAGSGVPHTILRLTGFHQASSIPLRCGVEWDGLAGEGPFCARWLCVRGGKRTCLTKPGRHLVAVQLEMNALFTLCMRAWACRR